MSTDYHAKYYAQALTRRSASDSLDKLGPSLLNATVDLNPHQIEAALFAFRSPLSRGAILADEVEVKARDELGAEDVKEKAKAAIRWCEIATEKQGGKPWSYVVIPDDAASPTSTLVFMFAQAVRSLSSASRSSA